MSSVIIHRISAVAVLLGCVILIGAVLSGNI